MYAASQINRFIRRFILARLTEADFWVIEPDLVNVDLPVRKILERSHRRIDSVYFPDSGFASVVADGAGKSPIEVGIIGREGMTGLAVLLGNDLPKNETYIQARAKAEGSKPVYCGKRSISTHHCTAQCSTACTLSSIRRL